MIQKAMVKMKSEEAAPQSAPALSRRGIMFVLASPPGGGKTTVSRAIMERDPETTVSVSATTRAMRPGEQEGVHYYFVSPEKFEELIKSNDMLEYAHVYNNFYYGTPKAPVEKALSEGRDVLFDIDWQGNLSLSKIAPDDVVSIFLLPPTWDELAHRLHNRKQDSEEEIERRLSKAKDEISHYGEFQYVIVNNNLEETIEKVHGILKAEREKRARVQGLPAFIETLVPSK